MREQGIVERIIDLTAKALAEKERDKFVKRLKERNLLLAPSVLDTIEIEEAPLKAWLRLEKDVLVRLEKEKGRVLREMESLSSKRRAAHLYTPRSPFPPMPVFFDKIG